MSTDTNGGNESAASTREFVEREYEIRAYPNGADFIHDLQQIRSGDAPRAHPDVESESKGAQREFARPFAEALTDRDVDEQRERERTDYVIQVGDEAIEIDHDTWEDMMRAAANSDEVAGLSFEESGRTKVSMRWSPKRLLREVFDAVASELPDEFSLSENSETFYRENSHRWETGDGEQYIDLRRSRGRMNSNPHPSDGVESNAKVPYYYATVEIVADAEAAVDLLDSQVSEAFQERLADLAVEPDEGYSASLWLETGEVTTEVCRRTT